MVTPTLNFNPRQARRLEGLHPRVYALGIALLTLALRKGVPLIITQGLRTIEEQNALYAQGRTKPGPIVTNAKGGYSYHNYGLAFDVAVLGPDGKCSWDTKVDVNKDSEPDYIQIGGWGKILGLEWGGDFKTIKDYPHFQFSFGLSLADLRSGKQPPTT